MKIEVVGSGQEVGRSCIVIRDKKDVMMDCGVKIEPEPPQYPRPEKVHAAIISHAHLDHVGAAPMLLKRGNPQIFMNDVTLELGTMLLKDSMKVAMKEGYNIPFSNKDIRRFVRSTRIVTQRDRFRVGECVFSLWHSGHVPGSSSILAECGKKIFYTSDIQTIDSHLLRRCRLPQNVDTLIIESTYGMVVQPPRQQLEEAFVEAVENTLLNNGVVLLPVFAVGRAQEMMMLLEDYINKMVIDGMAKTASEIISDYTYYLRDPQKYKSLMKKVKFVRSREDRKKALEKYRIIVSSAGMLNGGPAVSYLRSIRNSEESSVIFTGYLIEGTSGRRLLETGRYQNSEDKFDVRCNVSQFGLSAHADRRGLLEIIKRTNPKQVVCVHGDRCKEFAKDIESRFGIDAFAPKNNEVVRV